MSLILKRLKNEYDQLLKEPIMNCSAGPIGDNLNKWEATIFGPEDTPYAGGVFKLKIEITKEYPFKPPKIYFVTPIYHCNISKEGAICLDILKTQWSPALTIGNILLSICSLLASPNPDDPLEPDIANLYKTNKGIHDTNARSFTIKYAGL